VLRREGNVSDPNVDQPLEDIDAMFVQTAPPAEHVGGRLVLRSVAPATPSFGDRPQRVVGHVGTPEFVAIWGEGDGSFAADPPNAVRTFLAQGADVPAEVVVELRDPVLTGPDLSDAATVPDGSLPAKAGSCTLCIDMFGRPLTPVSVAGMRRTRRRAALLY
jgi:hypothetical protein